MNILRSLVVATTAWTLTASTFAAGDRWVSDFEKAKATAANFQPGMTRYLSWR